MKISKKELKSIYGGDGFSLFAGGVAAIAFLISVIEGFLNPTRCE